MRKFDFCITHYLAGFFVVYSIIIYICFITDKDKLHWDIVAFTGPPPPARFDFAMCTIEIPTCQVTSGNRENIVHEISEPVKDDENTSVKETSGEAKYSSEACGDSESASSVRQTSFNSVTVINPSGRDFEGVPDDSLQKFRGDEDRIEKLEVSSGNICWTDALYIFGGLDSAGEVYNDSFILVP